jgi:hypothetical protein
MGIVPLTMACIAGAVAAAGSLHLVVGLGHRRRQLQHVAFGSMCLFVAAWVMVGTGLHVATDPEVYAAILRHRVRLGCSDPSPPPNRPSWE